MTGDSADVVLVSRHLPVVTGTAAGRALAALREGLLGHGCRVTVTSWGQTPVDEDVVASLPPGCIVATARRAPRSVSVLRPRYDAVVLEVSVPPGALVVADDPVSWPAVAAHDPVVTVHHAVLPDARATGRREASLVQDRRFERRVAGLSRLEVLSARVGRVIGRPDARVVPIAHTMPADPLPPIESPVACLVADWRWAPNRVALARLLRHWPAVRAEVPTAHLLVAGRGESGIGTMPGVTWLGEVADSREVLGRAAVVAFPCPASSGPKVKSLEALAEGRALVTTRAGLEGLHLDRPPRRTGSFPDLLVEALRDPGAACERGRAAAASVRRAHAPAAAAATRLAGWRAAAGSPPPAARR